MEQRGDSPQWISAASGEVSDFDFAFAARDPDTSGPVFPLFGRPLSPSAMISKFAIENCEAGAVSGSSSDSDELEGLTEGTYCMWSPEQRQSRRRSASASGSGRWKLVKDLIARRSRSDGSGRLLFLAPPPLPEKKGKVDKKGSRERNVTAMDMVTAHRVFYGKKSERRTFLPYRTELVGFFW